MADIAEEIIKLLSKPAQESGFEIADAQYVKENGSMVARIFIDKENGVSLDDCEKASRIFSDILDARNLLPDSYILEVSSPGLNRTLKTEESFKRFTGSKIKVRTQEPINNQRNFLGDLCSFCGGIIEINDVTSGKVKIALSNVRKANVEEDF
ncbi:MAG: ribosome maturation factor RimP [Endomicrobium sp.]|jgi:ribosome maturation factor RimP|nr:ribosome maturation factor RimP [Endomicrobium sp.]